jgi:hypothetical protein
MVILETISALGYGAKDLFMYNRKGYMFDRTQTQERDYHIQGTRVDQVKLYRQDIKDLFTLTSQKMDQYLVLSTLGMLSTLGVVYNGRVPIDTPSWLFYLWTASSIGSLLFMMTSAWFSIHASVSAQIALTRMRTAWLRLPVPKPEQIPGAHGEDFEVVKAGASLRVPLVEASDDDTVAVVQASAIEDDDYTVFSDHFILYQQLYSRFQGYDAFSRVSLVIGTQQFLTLVNYVGLTLYMHGSSQIGAWAIPLIATCFGIANGYMNLLISHTQQYILAGSLLIAMILPGISTTQWMLSNSGTIALYVGPATFLAHIVCLGFYIAAAYFRSESGLPTLFATVTQADVLGLLHIHSEEASLADTIPEAYQVKKSIHRAITKRTSSLHELDNMHKARVSSAKSDMIAGHNDAVILVTDSGGKVPQLIEGTRSDLAEKSFYFVCVVSITIWLAGFFISFWSLFGASFTGWDDNPINNVLPSTGEYFS